MNQAKANKAQIKADKKRYGIFANQEKAAKTQFKTNQKTQKALDWLNKMDKTFPKTDISLTKEQIKLGENYINRLNLNTSIRATLNV